MKFKIKGIKRYRILMCFLIILSFSKGTVYAAVDKPNLYAGKFYVGADTINITNWNGIPPSEKGGNYGGVGGGNNCDNSTKERFIDFGENIRLADITSFYVGDNTNFYGSWEISISNDNLNWHILNVSLEPSNSSGNRKVDFSGVASPLNNFRYIKSKRTSNGYNFAIYMAYKTKYLKQDFREEFNSFIYNQTSSTQVNACDGILDMTDTGSIDPIIFMNNMGQYDPNHWRYMKVKYRYVSGNRNGADMAIYFKNSTYPGFFGSEYAAIHKPMNLDGLWHTQVFDMWEVPTWKTGGNITGWRFDWIGWGAMQSGVNYDTTIQVDWLEFSPYNDTPAQITLDNGSQTKYYKNNQIIEITGKVQDDENNKVTVKATIHGVTKTTTVENTTLSKDWVLRWGTNEIPQGIYNNIEFITE